MLQYVAAALRWGLCGVCEALCSEQGWTMPTTTKIMTLLASVKDGQGDAAWSRMTGALPHF